MGAGDRVLAPPRAAAPAVRGTEPGAWQGSRMAVGAAASAWVLVLGLWGAAGGAQNITARIGQPLVLDCKGAPRKPPQQLEWKLNTGRTEAWKVLSPQGDSWDSVARVLLNGSLLLPAVGVQDEGTFRCRATSRHGKETKSNYRVRVYQIPGKPVIIDPASELTAGVPSKVGTCVSEGGYPAGTLSWHLDGKPLLPDGKGVAVKEEIRRQPETGLFTVQSELTVTPTRAAARPSFSCSFSPRLPRRRALHTAPVQPSVWGERGAGEPKLGQACSGSMALRESGVKAMATGTTQRCDSPPPEPVPLEEVQLVVEPEGGAVAPGETVTLTCEAPAQPPPQIHWIKDGVPLPLPSSPVLLLPEAGPQDQGTYSCVATHPRHGPQESPTVSVRIIETGEDGMNAGSVGESGLGTLALALGILGGVGTAALLIGVIVWRRRQHRGQERKAPETQEEAEERAELHQAEEPEAAEGSAGGP